MYYEWLCVTLYVVVNTIFDIIVGMEKLLELAKSYGGKRNLKKEATNLFPVFLLDRNLKTTTLFISVTIS